MDLYELQTKFNTEKKCRKYLEKMRWPNGISCPRCANTTISTLKDYDRYECAKCEYQFTVTSGTIMHRTHLPLCKWLLAIHLICESKKGISANQLKRHLNVAYQTAWYLGHRIRNAMKHDVVEDKLGGILETDDAYIGGKGNKPGRPGKDSPKTPIIGVVERTKDGTGKVKCIAVSDLKGETILKFIANSINKDTVEIIYSDEFRGYRVLKGDLYHKTVNHRISMIQGKAHTNTMESFWSLLKRGIMGAFHHVSIKHLDRYLAEFTWRFNQRSAEDVTRNLVLNYVKPHEQYTQMVG